MDAFVERMAEAAKSVMGSHDAIMHSLKNRRILFSPMELKCKPSHGGASRGMLVVL